MVNTSSYSSYSKSGTINNESSKSSSNSTNQNSLVSKDASFLRARQTNNRIRNVQYVNPVECPQIEKYPCLDTCPPAKWPGIDLPSYACNERQNCPRVLRLRVDPIPRPPLRRGGDGFDYNRYRGGQMRYETPPSGPGDFNPYKKSNVDKLSNDGYDYGSGSGRNKSPDYFEEYYKDFKTRYMLGHPDRQTLLSSPPRSHWSNPFQDFNQTIPDARIITSDYGVPYARSEGDGSSLNPDKQAGESSPCFDSEELIDYRYRRCCEYEDDSLSDLPGQNHPHQRKSGYPSLKRPLHDDNYSNHDIINRNPVGDKDNGIFSPTGSLKQSNPWFPSSFDKPNKISPDRNNNWDTPSQLDEPGLTKLSSNPNPNIDRHSSEIFNHSIPQDDVTSPENLSDEEHIVPFKPFPNYEAKTNVKPPGKTSTETWRTSKSDYRDKFLKGFFTDFDPEVLKNPNPPSTYNGSTNSSSKSHNSNNISNDSPPNVNYSIKKLRSTDSDLKNSRSSPSINPDKDDSKTSSSNKSNEIKKFNYFSDPKKRPHPASIDSKSSPSSETRNYNQQVKRDSSSSVHENKNRHSLPGHKNKKNSSDSDSTSNPNKYENKKLNLFQNHDVRNDKERNDSSSSGHHQHQPFKKRSGQPDSYENKQRSSVQNQKNIIKHKKSPDSDSSSHSGSSSNHYDRRRKSTPNKKLNSFQNQEDKINKRKKLSDSYSSPSSDDHHKRKQSNPKADKQQKRKSSQNHNIKTKHKKTSSDSDSTSSPNQRLRKKSDLNVDKYKQRKSVNPQDTKTKRKNQSLDSSSESSSKSSSEPKLQKNPQGGQHKRNTKIHKGLNPSSSDSSPNKAKGHDHKNIHPEYNKRMSPHLKQLIENIHNKKPDQDNRKNKSKDDNPSLENVRGKRHIKHYDAIIKTGENKRISLDENPKHHKRVSKNIEPANPNKQRISWEDSPRKQSWERENKRISRDENPINHKRVSDNIGPSHPNNNKRISWEDSPRNPKKLSRERENKRTSRDKNPKHHTDNIKPGNHKRISWDDEPRKQSQERDNKKHSLKPKARPHSASKTSSSSSSSSSKQRRKNKPDTKNRLVPKAVPKVQLPKPGKDAGKITKPRNSHSSSVSSSSSKIGNNITKKQMKNLEPEAKSRLSEGSSSSEEVLLKQVNKKPVAKPSKGDTSSDSIPQKRTKPDKLPDPSLIYLEKPRKLTNSTVVFPDKSAYPFATDPKKKSTTPDKARATQPSKPSPQIKDNTTTSSSSSPSKNTVVKTTTPKTIPKIGRDTKNKVGSISSTSSTSSEDELIKHVTTKAVKKVEDDNANSSSSSEASDVKKEGKPSTKSPKKLISINTPKKKQTNPKEPMLQSIKMPHLDDQPNNKNETLQKYLQTNVPIRNNKSLSATPEKSGITLRSKKSVVKIKKASESESSSSSDTQIVKHVTKKSVKQKSLSTSSSSSVAENGGKVNKNAKTPLLLSIKRNQELPSQNPQKNKPELKREPTRHESVPNKELKMVPNPLLNEQTNHKNNILKNNLKENVPASEKTGIKPRNKKSVEKMGKTSQSESSSSSSDTQIVKHVTKKSVKQKSLSASSSSSVSENGVKVNKNTKTPLLLPTKKIQELKSKNPQQNPTELKTEPIRHEPVPNKELKILPNPLLNGQTKNKNSILKEHLKENVPTSEKTEITPRKKKSVGKIRKPSKNESSSSSSSDTQIVKHVTRKTVQQKSLSTSSSSSVSENEVKVNTNPTTKNAPQLPSKNQTESKRKPIKHELVPHKELKIVPKPFLNEQTKNKNNFLKDYLKENVPKTEKTEITPRHKASIGKVKKVSKSESSSSSDTQVVKHVTKKIVNPKSLSTSSSSSVLENQATPNTNPPKNQPQILSKDPPTKQKESKRKSIRHDPIPHKELKVVPKPILGDEQTNNKNIFQKDHLKENVPKKEKTEITPRNKASIGKVKKVSKSESSSSSDTQVVKHVTKKIVNPKSLSTSSSSSVLENQAKPNTNPPKNQPQILSKDPPTKQKESKRKSIRHDPIPEIVPKPGLNRKSNNKNEILQKYLQTNVPTRNNRSLSATPEKSGITLRNKKSVGKLRKASESESSSSSSDTEIVKHVTRKTVKHELLSTSSSSSVSVIQNHVKLNANSAKNPPNLTSKNNPQIISKNTAEKPKELKRQSAKHDLVPNKPLENVPKPRLNDKSNIKRESSSSSSDTQIVKHVTKKIVKPKSLSTSSSSHSVLKQEGKVNTNLAKNPPQLVSKNILTKPIESKRKSIKHDPVPNKKLENVPNPGLNVQPNNKNETLQKYLQTNVAARNNKSLSATPEKSGITLRNKKSVGKIGKLSESESSSSSSETQIVKHVTRKTVKHESLSTSSSSENEAKANNNAKTPLLLPSKNTQQLQSQNPQTNPTESKRKSLRKDPVSNKELKTVTKPLLNEQTKIKNTQENVLTRNKNPSITPKKTEIMPRKNKSVEKIRKPSESESSSSSSSDTQIVKHVTKKIVQQKSLSTSSSSENEAKVNNNAKTPLLLPSKNTQQLPSKNPQTNQTELKREQIPKNETKIVTKPLLDGQTNNKINVLKNNLKENVPTSEKTGIKPRDKKSVGKIGKASENESSSSSDTQIVKHVTKKAVQKKSLSVVKNEEEVNTNPNKNRPQITSKNTAEKPKELKRQSTKREPDANKPLENVTKLRLNGQQSNVKRDSSSSSSETEIIKHVTKKTVKQKSLSTSSSSSVAENVKTSQKLPTKNTHQLLSKNPQKNQTELKPEPIKHDPAPNKELKTVTKPLLSGQTNIKNTQENVPTRNNKNPSITPEKTEVTPRKKKSVEKMGKTSESESSSSSSDTQIVKHVTKKIVQQKSLSTSSSSENGVKVNNNAKTPLLLPMKKNQEPPFQNPQQNQTELKREPIGHEPVANKELKILPNPLSNGQTNKKNSILKNNLKQNVPTSEKTGIKPREKKSVGKASESESSSSSSDTQIIKHVTKKIVQQKSLSTSSSSSENGVKVNNNGKTPLLLPTKNIQELLKDPQRNQIELKREPIKPNKELKILPNPLLNGQTNKKNSILKEHLKENMPTLEKTGIKPRNKKSDGNIGKASESKSSSSSSSDTQIIKHVTKKIVQQKSLSTSSSSSVSDKGTRTNIKQPVIDKTPLIVPTQTPEQKGQRRRSSGKNPKHSLKPQKQVLQNDTRKQSLEKGPRKKSLEKGPKKQSLEKGARKQLLDARKQSLEKGPRKKSLEKNERKQSLQNGPRKQSLEKGPKKKSLDKGPTKQSLEKGARKKSLEKDNGPKKQSLEKDPRKKSLEKGIRKISLEKNPRKQSIEKGARKKSLEKEKDPRKQSLEKKQSQKKFSFNKRTLKHSLTKNPEKKDEIKKPPENINENDSSSQSSSSSETEIVKHVTTKTITKQTANESSSSSSSDAILATKGTQQKTTHSPLIKPDQQNNQLDSKKRSLKNDPKKRSVSKDTKKQSLSKDPKKQSLSKDPKKQSLSKDTKKQSLSKDPKKQSLSKDTKKKSLSKDPKRLSKNKGPIKKENLETRDPKKVMNTTQNPALKEKPKQRSKPSSSSSSENVLVKHVTKKTKPNVNKEDSSGSSSTSSENVLVKHVTKKTKPNVNKEDSSGSSSSSENVLVKHVTTKTKTIEKDSSGSSSSSSSENILVKHVRKKTVATVPSSSSEESSSSSEETVIVKHVTKKTVAKPPVEDEGSDSSSSSNKINEI